MLGVFLVATLAVAEPAADDPDAVPLFAEWEAPAECPDRDELRAAIEAEIGQEVRFDDDAIVRVSGTAIAIDRGYRVDLVIAVGEDREARVMTAPACIDAVQASALVVAVALEPFLVSPPSVPAPQPTHDPPPPPATTTPTPPAAASTARPRRRRFHHRAALFVGGGGAFAMTAPAIGVVHGGAAWLIDRARIELSAHHRFATRPEPNRFSARMSLTGAAARGCWLPRLRAFEIGPCGGLEVAALVAEGTGADVTTRRQTVPWLSLLGAVDFAWIATPWLALRTSAAAGIVPRRPQLHIASGEDHETVFLASPVNARVTLVLELRLPGAE